MWQINFQKAMAFFDALEDITPENYERERRKRKDMFDRLIFDAEKLDDISEISLDDMIQMISEVDGYCGGKFSEDKEIDRIGEEVFKVKSYVEQLHVL